MGEFFILRFFFSSFFKFIVTRIITLKVISSINRVEVLLHFIYIKCRLKYESYGIEILITA